MGQGSLAGSFGLICVRDAPQALENALRIAHRHLTTFLCDVWDPDVH
jgi:hypothetical protein